jgi:ERCC4-related helicase
MINWFGPQAQAIKDVDPKLDRVQEQIDTLLSERPDRKIVIFSTYADTVNYLSEELRKGEKSEY